MPGGVVLAAHLAVYEVVAWFVDFSGLYAGSVLPEVVYSCVEGFFAVSVVDDVSFPVEL